MSDKLVIPTWVIPIALSSVIGFGSYQAALADANNTKADVLELKKTVSEVADRAVEAGTIAEVNTAKIDAVVETLQRMEQTNQRTQQSLESLVNHLLTQQN
jgi:hypothetical protein